MDIGGRWSSLPNGGRVDLEGRLLYLKGLIGAWFENETVGSVRGPCQFMTVLEGGVWIRLHGILLFHRGDAT